MTSALESEIAERGLVLRVDKQGDRHMAYLCNAGKNCPFAQADGSTEDQAINAVARAAGIAPASAKRQSKKAAPASAPEPDDQADES